MTVLPLVSKDTNEYVKAFETEKSWIPLPNPCNFCHKKSDIVCRISVGFICSQCALNMLSLKAGKVQIQLWNFEKIQHMLGPDGSLSERIIALFRYSDLERLQCISKENALLRLRELLIENMGYMSTHPLARFVRQTAVNTCSRRIGKAILPLLLSKIKREPWQYYSNIVLTAFYVAPNSISVQQLVEEASKSDNPEVRSIILKTIKDLKFPWIKRIIENSKSNDQNKAFSKQDVLSADHLKIQEAINEAYKLEDLRSIYGVYFHNSAISKQYKKDLVKELTCIFVEKERFQKVLDEMPKGVKEVFSLLIWERDEYDAFRLSQSINDPIMINKVKTNQYRRELETTTINDVYRIIPIKKANQYMGIYQSDGFYTFHLPVILRNLLKPFFPAPKEINLIPYDEIQKTEYVYIDSDHILKQIDLFNHYISHGLLKFTKSSDKVQKSSLKQLVKQCNIQEFYNEKDTSLNYLKTNLIVDFLLEVKEKKKQKGQESKPELPQKYIKHLFDNLFDTTGDLFGYHLYNLLGHLKGIDTLSGYHLQNEIKVKKSLINLMKTLPVTQWFSVTDLIKYCKYRDIHLHIIDKDYANQYITCVLTHNNKYNYRNIQISPVLYNEVITVPFFKSIMFLLASFGLVDIAYDYPQNTLYTVEKKYLTAFDGLKYIRLTPLGAYVFNQSDAYEVKIETTENNFYLDETRLFIYFDSPNPIKMMLLEKMAGKVTDLCYKIDYKSFLKDCKSQADIKLKIKLFKEHISNSPPPLWKKFFEDVLSKINPLEIKTAIRVYKLPENKDLIYLIAKDELLKKYILKGEDYHILIDSADTMKVKNRLELFGYFIDNM
ncbi:MAG: hypothetical protein HQK77_04545 [Desulfobacterales bacterium]|nr:hypothetical protein [Desulfobacterales bacterium]